MGFGSRGLLTEIERGASDNRKNLSEVLRKCVVLGDHSRSAELRDWARQELDGYASRNVPKYRRVTAPLLLDGIQGNFQLRGKQISVLELPEFAQDSMRDGLTIPFGVAELERLAKGAKTVNLQEAGFEDLAYFMNRSRDYNVQVERLYYSVNPVVFHGIIDAVRTNLVALVAELRASGATDAQMPTAASADRAVNVVVKGFARANVAIGDNAVASSDGDAVTPQTRLPVIVRAPWALAVGGATIVGGVGAAASLGWFG